MKADASAPLPRSGAAPALPGDVSASRTGKATHAAEWRPSAALDTLRRRAALVERVRTFFRGRGVLEVETPVLALATTPESQLASFEVHSPGEGRVAGWLQTSPEFAMKRLVCAGSGPIFQITKAFRAGEEGRFHNPEFSILEWYRPGYTYETLIEEVEVLLCELLQRSGARRLTYREAFRRHAGLDPLEAGGGDLRRLCRARGWHGAAEADRDACLDFLLEHAVQGRLGKGIVCVLDFPASQSSGARLKADDPALAERFEVYVDGIEVGNGYRELTDAQEQLERFERDRRNRRQRGLPDAPIDHRLIAALRAGMPECSGVALGLDRLVMLATGRSRLEEVVSFAHSVA